MIYDNTVLATFFVVGGGLLTVMLLLYAAFTNESGRTSDQRLQKASRRNAKERDKKLKHKNKATSVLQRDVQKGKIDDFLTGLGSSKNTLRLRILQAGLNIGVMGFLLVHLAVFFVISGTLMFITEWPVPYILATGLIAGLILPQKFLSFKISKRMKAFESLFPDALELMGRGLKTGMPITETIKIVGENVSDPVGLEFQKVYNDIKFGLPLTDAIWKVTERMPTQEFKFFAISVSLQAETGGNLAENLKRLGEVLRSRLDVYRLIKSKSSEAKWSARVLSSLPFVFIGLMFLSSQEYMDTMLFTEKGRQLTIGCFGMIFIGIMMMRKMTKFDF